MIPFGLLFLVFLWWKPLDASACSCISPPPPEVALDKADAVFSGEVVEITENERIIRGYGNNIHFKVDKVWKGTDASEIVVTTGYGGGDCGISFEKGQQYLVYATLSDMYVKNALSTTICHRTTEISSATEDLNALGEGQEVSEPEASETFVESTNREKDKKADFPWWAFVVFIVGLIIIYIGFIYKNSEKSARR